MRISAIVPTWNESASIQRLVRRLETEVDEVWVADAQSPDGTADRAREAGAHVVESDKGRGAQLIAGAAASRGEALVFVHADTGIPQGFGAAIRAALLAPDIIGGNFRIRYAPDGPVAVAFSYANEWRQRLFGTYYGDSCIFVLRSAYERIGGFSSHPLFEDFIFARALERLGKTRYVTEPAITSSARRFERRPLRTLAQWGLLQAAFSLGIPPDRLSRYYADSHP